jgi:hypothetical protein
MKCYLMEVLDKDGVWKIAAHEEFPDAQAAITKALKESGREPDHVRVSLAPEGYHPPPDHCCPWPDCGEPICRFVSDGQRTICRKCGKVIRHLAS